MNEMQELISEFSIFLYISTYIKKSFSYYNSSKCICWLTEIWTFPPSDQTSGIWKFIETEYVLFKIAYNLA